MMGVQDAARRQMNEAFEGLRNDLQEAKDYRVKKELELARNEAWGQFQESLKERGEEEKWAEQWEKQSAEVAKPFLQMKGLSLKAKRELEFEQKAWAQQTRLGVQNLATQRGIEVSAKVAYAAADSAWDNGDEQGARTVYAEMVERKLLDARLVPQMVEKGRARMQVQEVMGLLNTDPIAALEMIKERREDNKPKHFDRLSEEQRYTLENHANRRASELRQKTYQDLAERMQGGEVLGDKELAELVERKLLKATDAQRIKKQRAAGGMKPESIEFMELFHRARVYDAARDPSFEVADRIMAESLGMADFDRRRLWAILEQGRMGGNGGGAGGSRASGANEVRKVALDAISSRFAAGVYGSPVDDFNKENREAMFHRYTVEDEIDRFMAQNPNASKVQVLRFLDEVEARVKQAGVARDVLGAQGLPYSNGRVASATTSAASGTSSPMSVAQVGDASNAVVEALLSKDAAGEEPKKPLRPSQVDWAKAGETLDAVANQGGQKK